MNKVRKAKQLFYDYFEEWIELYKVGAIRDVSLGKYYIALKHLEKIAPSIRMCDLDRRTYQEILNEYAKTHEKQTTMDFHHQIKGAVLDAIDEGILDSNPTRKVIIKGKKAIERKQKFLNQFEVQSLIRQMDLGNEINWDWFILLVTKTGLRFSEALALTPEDFDFSKQTLTINKTWDYKKSNGSFLPTKNESSNRKIQLDWQTAMHFSQLLKEYPTDNVIFVKKRVFNSTINKRLEVLCNMANIPVISIHSLRHTHASLLLYAGVSVASVAKRLGHSNMSITQKTYLHIITELENQDNTKIVQFLSNLI
ncbi:site-specific integrase [Fundicoccus culcitae]|uniref:Site-specific integrase n=1 Tax=Fundicoccus culcitae TaxID=2969821 RepID=A0ABY5P7L1_9LACT|nr:site-specific integrase [Fundicoccus culcitae]UUX34719.1 site-specific integrase [Fundicoccus culcitae]